MMIIENLKNNILIHDRPIIKASNLSKDYGEFEPSIVLQFIDALQRSSAGGQDVRTNNRMTVSSFYHIILICLLYTAQV